MSVGSPSPLLSPLPPFAVDQSSSGNTLTASDLAVVPDAPDAVAIARVGQYNLFAGAAIVDSGRIQPRIGPGDLATHAIIFVQPAALVGVDLESSDVSLGVLASCTDGVDLVRATPYVAGQYDPDLRVDQGLLVNGRYVIDPAAGRRIGEYHPLTGCTLV